MMTGTVPKNWREAYRLYAARLREKEKTARKSKEPDHAMLYDWLAYELESLVTDNADHQLRREVFTRWRKLMGEE